MTYQHTCRLNDVWPTGHPLPPEDPARLQGPEVGTLVLYTRRSKSGRFNRELDRVLYEEVISELPALVLHRSYVWSPGECRHKGGYRHYDWTVIEVHEAERTYTVVVNDTDLKEVTK